MVYFRKIVPTRHYLEEHEKDVAWHEVIETILTVKNPRKKGNTFEIENEKYYVVFRIDKAELHVINAKKK